MKRQEQIKMAATAKSRGESPYYYDAFVEGAEWADENPHWISVEDELPPLEILCESWETSDDVLVYTLSCDILVSRYEFDKLTQEHYWVFSDHDYIVTHWMYIPYCPPLQAFCNKLKKLLDTPPTKGDNQ